MSDVSRPESVSGSVKAQFIAAIKKAKFHNVVQKNTNTLIQNLGSELASDFNARHRNTFKDIQKRGGTKQDTPQKQAQEAKAPAPPENTELYSRAESLAKFYQRRNVEMSAIKLMTVFQEVQQSKNAEEVIDKIIKRFSDPSLVDEALDFLLESLHPGSSAYKRVREAKQLMRTLRGREIVAGRNMGDVSRAHPDLDAPGELRELYRDITGNPREAQTLFEELIQKYTYDKMKEAIEFILQALRADLTAKGSSISKGQLHTLVTEAKNMQAILGVYRFFKSRGRIIRQQYEQHQLSIDQQLHFENLARQLVTLLKERYPSVDKMLRFASSLGIPHDIMAQIIILTQYRDAMRGVSPRLFKNEKHRQEMLMTLIEALSDLEDELDEDEEEE